MKMVQNTIERNFTINHKGQTYHISYLNSDGQTLSLLNRDNWEIFDENDEELNIHIFKNASKKEQKKVGENLKLFGKIITFCKKNFYQYKPEI